MKTANQTEVRSRPAKQVQAWRSGERCAMLGFLTIFAVTLAGYAAAPTWSVAASAVVLATISYAQFHRLYARGNELGMSQLVEATQLRTFANALVASGAAYGLGWLVRVL